MTVPSFALPAILPQPVFMPLMLMLARGAPIVPSLATFTPGATETACAAPAAGPSARNCFRPITFTDWVEPKMEFFVGSLLNVSSALIVTAVNTSAVFAVVPAFTTGCIFELTGPAESPAVAFAPYIALITANVIRATGVLKEFVSRLYCIEIPLLE
jgi:hypothetical protein